uniref:Major histocompatibility complex, class II, DQ alpha 1 n=1 Tax=Homo sapiens TaxID=9606 RepID=A0A0G2JKJ3_HUMAN
MILNKALMLGALALTTVMSPCGGEDIVGSISDSLLLYRDGHEFVKQKLKSQIVKRGSKLEGTLNFHNLINRGSSHSDFVQQWKFHPLLQSAWLLCSKFPFFSLTPECPGQAQLIH